MGRQQGLFPKIFARRGVNPSAASNESSTTELVREEKPRHSLNMFLGHMMSFLPLVMILAIAVMWVDPGQKLLLFACFTGATISLEVCLSCLREMYGQICQLGAQCRLTLKAGDIERGELLEAALAVTKGKWIDCWKWSAVTTVLWMTVAAGEVLHLSGDGAHASAAEQQSGEVGDHEPAGISGGVDSNSETVGHTPPKNSLATRRNVFASLDARQVWIVFVSPMIFIFALKKVWVVVNSHEAVTELLTAIAPLKSEPKMLGTATEQC